MTVSVHIVTWNSELFLPTLLQSLKTQTRQPDRILVIDNASADQTLNIIKQWPGVHLLRNTRNLGFARAHNQAIAISPAEAILVTNPDVILTPSCIAKLAAALEENVNTGSVSAKLLRYTLDPHDLSQPQPSDTVDVAGLVLRRSRQVVNRGEGSSESFDRPADVFGAPGVLALYRRQALEDVKINGELFDEDFFAYKEDADLAWRLRWAGWSARYIPSAVAYHHRAQPHHDDTVRGVSAVRPHRSPAIRTWSYRNHLLMLVKNETAGTFWPHLPFILFYELRRLGYLLWREWSTLKGLWQAIRLLPRMIKKRRVIAQHRRLSSAAFRRLITP
ncbi:MAG: glycosyltransferase family 2 protein [Candidatus Kerfeldbacteria bacterium]|nr:glycosyltransferase family 2 protein [Candidatus Kerfeldbacteria bacterium]